MIETLDNAKQNYRPHLEAPGAYLPLQYYIDFLKFLNGHRDTIQIITYQDLPWRNDYDFCNSYPEEWRNWGKQIGSQKASKNKIYLLLQHDVDNHPERTKRLLQEEKNFGIRSNVMIFNRLINRERLEKTGDLEFEDYSLDDLFFRQIQGDGFVIGYHCNAYEQALFDPVKAEQFFLTDVHELRKRFNIKYFSAHGGVRDSSGRSNFCIHVPETLRRSIRWVHNAFGPRFHDIYSDGGFPSGKKAPEALDLRRFVKTLSPGQRYQILIHPQYYHDYPLRISHMETVPWYREVCSVYRKSGERLSTSDDGPARRPQRSVWNSI